MQASTKAVIPIILFTALSFVINPGQINGQPKGRMGEYSKKQTSGQTQSGPGQTKNALSLMTNRPIPPGAKDAMPAETITKTEKPLVDSASLAYLNQVFRSKLMKIRAREGVTTVPDTSSTLEQGGWKHLQEITDAPDNADFHEWKTPADVRFIQLKKKTEKNRKTQINDMEEAIDRVVTVPNGGSRTLSELEACVLHLAEHLAGKDSPHRYVVLDSEPGAMMGTAVNIYAREVRPGTGVYDIVVDASILVGY